MSALRKTQPKLTPEEYLAIEEQAEFRSEYENGVMIPLHGASVEMSGATINHAQIISNLLEVLSPQLKKKDCRTFSTDVKVWVDQQQRFYYPDLLVICGKIDFYQNRCDTVQNPSLLIEVLSDSTEANDRAEKFWSYQTLESLQEYVLISQNKAVVERFTRQTDGTWIYLATIGLESSVTFQSVNTSLTLREVYDLVEFETEE